jgi:hypothetical protein
VCAARATPLSRTPDGQPDVQGYWGSDAYTQDLETGLPDEETNIIQGRGPVDRSKAISRIVDPADGKIPYQQWAQERRVRIPTFRRGDPSRGEPKSARDIRPQTFCLIGLPRLNWYSDYRIIQTPGHVVMAWEWSHAFRVIPLDAMTMVERFAFADSNTMEYTVTITDPKVLTRPFTIKLPYQRVNRPANFEMYEEACVEGTKSADTVGFSVR